MCATWMCKVKITPKSTKKKFNLKAVVIMHYTLHFPTHPHHNKIGCNIIPLSEYEKYIF